MREPGSPWQSLVAALRHRLARQALWIMVWQALARLAGLVGSAWAARCLGPEKLGISGAVLAGVGIAMLLRCVLNDTLLVRRLHPIIVGGAGHLDQGVISAVALQAVLALGLCAAALPLGFFLPGHNWLLAFWAGVFLLFVLAIQPNWLLMAQENMTAVARSRALTSIVSALFLSLFIRPGAGAGAASDVVVAAAGTLAGCALAWATAGRGTDPRWDGSPEFFASLAHSLRSGGWRQSLPLVAEGRWLFFTSVLTYMYVAIQAPLLGWLAGLDVLGAYQSANILVEGINQLLVVVPTLLYPRFVAWRKRGIGLLWSRQIQITRWTLAAAAPAICATLLFGPALHRFLFGAAFESASGPFAVFLVAKIVVVVNGIFAWGLWADGRERVLLAWVLGPVAALSLVANLVLIPRFGLWAASGVNLGSEIAVLVGGWLLAWRYCRHAG